MGLFYLEEHKTCYHYAERATATFKVYHLQHDSPPARACLERSLIVFVVEGESLIRYGAGKPFVVPAGRFFLVEPGTLFTGHQSSPALVMTMAFVGAPKLCNIYTLENLVRDTQGAALPADPHFTLPIRPRLREFLDLVMHCLDDGLSCAHYHELKREEFFQLVRAYYSKEELAGLFRPLLGIDHDFRQQVLDAYANGHGDVATLAESLHVSPATFQRKFKQSFHETAGQWLLDRKAERIIRQLKTTSLTFDQICFENGFSSLAYFSNFCKRVFGKTPTELRNEAF